MEDNKQNCAEFDRIGETNPISHLPYLLTYCISEKVKLFFLFV